MGFLDRYKKIIILSVLCLLLSYISLGQNKSSAQLAYSYYKNAEYLKAATLYKDLYEKKHSKYYFNYMLKSYVNADELKLAEQVIKKTLRKTSDAYFKIKLGGVYKKQGKKEKAEKLFKKVIQKTEKRNQISSIANSFVEDGELTYAEKIYLKGRKISQQETDFCNELANVYWYMHDYPKMVNEYLRLIAFKPSFLRYVENRLQNMMKQQDNGLKDVLKKALITRIQKDYKLEYSELLVWLYIQEDNFRQAYRQTLAIDKRRKEQGKRLLELGYLAYENTDYPTAIKSYTYVKDLKPRSPYLEKALLGLIKSRQAVVLEETPPSLSAIDSLASEYESVFSQKIYDKNVFVELKIDYAHLLGFYQQKVHQAVALLEKIQDLPSVQKRWRSKVKLELADLMLLDNNIWEATLYYSQVIKDNPNNEIGHKAQIQKARLSYYSGDFLWAKAQLDILKAATTKFIANDALVLSQIILENQEDSSYTALRMLSKSDLYLFQNKTDSALFWLDSLSRMNISPSLEDDILFKKAQIYTSKQELETAKKLYQKITEEYYSDILGDNALYNWAMILIQEEKNEEANELLTRLLFDFPNSVLASKARQKIVQFRDS